MNNVCYFIRDTLINRSILIEVHLKETGRNPLPALIFKKILYIYSLNFTAYHGFHYAIPEAI